MKFQKTKSPSKCSITRTQGARVVPAVLVGVLALSVLVTGSVSAQDRRTIATYRSVTRALERITTDGPDLS